jgi:hypothetical protein
MGAIINVSVDIPTRIPKAFPTPTFSAEEKEVAKTTVCTTGKKNKLA